MNKDSVMEESAGFNFSDSNISRLTKSAKK